jgi:hypothetical protein
MNQSYFVRNRYYKIPVEGEIININNRDFGIHKYGINWIITDILTGLSISQYPLKSKKEAIDYIKNNQIDWNSTIVKDNEQFFITLEEYNENKIYINKIEERNNETSYYKGQYKKCNFNITISISKCCYEIDYFNGDFTEEEIAEIAEYIVNSKN